MIYSFSVFIKDPKRVDIFLSTLFSEFSRSYIQKIIDNWNISLNNKIINKNIKIKNKDEIKMIIVLKDLDVKPENIKLDIVYEDKEIIIINKESNINVHPVPWKNWKTWTLVNALLFHCRNNLPSIWWVIRPWIIHRLDKDTSGLIMVAKTDKMMKYLSYIIKERKINKYYIAIVNWIIKNKEFKIESYIWRDPNNRVRMTSRNPINPKIAISYWKVVKYINNKYTLVKIKIETWRTHQIRVHLSSIWHSILWDKVYWDSKTNKRIKFKYNLDRQALHAYELEFKLYWKKVSFIWEIKDDIKKIIS